MKIRYATISKEGRRSNNEDFFVVMDQQERGRFWGIVCDGDGWSRLRRSGERDGGSCCIGILGAACGGKG